MIGLILHFQDTYDLIPPVTTISIMPSIWLITFELVSIILNLLREVYLVCMPTIILTNIMAHQQFWLTIN